MSAPAVEFQKVAMDADGVIVDFATGVASYALRTRRLIFDPANIHPNPGANKDPELNQIITDLLYNPEEVEALPAFPDTLEGLHILGEEGYIPEVVSARHERTLGVATQRWAQNNGLAHLLHDFHLWDGWTSHSDFKVSKALEIKAVGAFDDDDHYIYRYARARFRSIHIRKPGLPIPRFDLNHPLITQHATFLEGVRAFVGQPDKIYVFT